MRNFRNLIVWQDSMELCKNIYLLTSTFPEIERFNLAKQMQKAAISIPSNIAEGSSRKSETDFLRFIEISLGSTYELETQLILAFEFKYLTEEVYKELVDKLISIQKKLNTLSRKVRENYLKK